MAVAHCAQGHWLPNDAEVPLDDMNWLFLAPR
jgi:hypothetical protein